MKTSADFFIIKLLPTAFSLNTPCSCKIVIVEGDRIKTNVNKESDFKTNEKGWKIKQKG